jgi:hypothetical protein
MKSARILPVIGGLAVVAACVPQREAPPPPPPPQPVPMRPAPPPPPPPPADWRDRPVTPGSWSYRSDGNVSQASFGAGGAPAFVVRCDRTQRRIVLESDGVANGSVMTIRTSFGARNLPVTAGQPLAAAVPASDRFLDSMVFSRGRFTVEAAGRPMLVIPSWPEPARVIEDCRS